MPDVDELDEHDPCVNVPERNIIHRTLIVVNFHCGCRATIENYFHGGDRAAKDAARMAEIVQVCQYHEGTLVFRDLSWRDYNALGEERDGFGRAYDICAASKQDLAEALQALKVLKLVRRGLSVWWNYRRRNGRYKWLKTDAKNKTA